MEEKGKSATFLNPLKDEGLLPIKVDGCVVEQGTRADYVIEDGRSAVVVELKGRHVEQAAKQVFATASQWVGAYDRADRVAGLIIATRYPKASTKIQIEQSNFQKRFLVPLHVVCHNAEFDFDAVFSFRPLKSRD